ncbi:helix-turn-helix transcriptional regulator [Antrihabitans cavernicola]|uniref:Helix-turn-helix transcriptional regulator n=2 Tax=Antrihabitans cavernicola TaxID=2495913 RepID=A0A5A7SBS4_9NOCA|nr:helix-turn-helix transcriptional regulator [Spelaeibacter cavernicola]
MPSPYLTVILTIDEPIHMGATAAQGPTSWDTLASGISAAPCTIVHDGNQHGIQLSLTPLGSRALFGMPTAAIGAWMVDLEDVIGSDASELRERIAAHDSWDERFAILDEVFLRRIDALDEVKFDPTLERAWQLLTADAGNARVADVAADVGWSRRHLVNRFAGEFGITPKDSARIARFSAAHSIMRRVEIPSVAEIAALCGYYDQAHMARDWRELAGMSPSRWRAAEQFTFVQADDTDDDADLSA